MQDQNDDSTQKELETAPLGRKEKTFVELYEWIESMVLAVVFVILLFTFGARTSVVSGSSMVDTLHDGDMLVISRWGFSADPGDVVVVTKIYFENEPIIKRVIATEGQSVDIDFVEGTVYVNGEALDEPYTHTPTNRSYDMEFPVTVPDGQVFVLGDNRNGSYDSRATEIGFVDTRYVLGKAYLRVFPFDAMGAID